MKTLIATIATLLTAQIALACACCSEPGTFSNYIGVPMDWTIDQMVGKKIEGRLDQGFGAAGTGEYWNYTGTLEKDKVVLQTTKNGKPAGKIYFHFNESWKFFATDLLNPTQEQRQSGSDLYKHVEISGRAYSDNAELDRAAGYPQLVLKGTGNGCSHDFKQWILSFNGRDGEYGLFSNGYFK